MPIATIWRKSEDSKEINNKTLEEKKPKELNYS